MCIYLHEYSIIFFLFVHYYIPLIVHLYFTLYILKLVQIIIAKTKGDGEKAGEAFWVKAEKLYYTALIGCIFYEAPREEKNLATLLDMIDDPPYSQSPRCHYESITFLKIYRQFTKQVIR